MTRTTTAFLAAGLFLGCGGDAPSVKTAAEPPKSTSTAPVETAKAAPVAAPKPPTKAAVKAADEPPGLDLPEDVEAVGGKPPELPIR